MMDRLHLILAGLQRTVLEVSPNAPKVFDQSDSMYRDQHVYDGHVIPYIES